MNRLHFSDEIFRRIGKEFQRRIHNTFRKSFRVKIRAVHLIGKGNNSRNHSSHYQKSNHRANQGNREFAHFRSEKENNQCRNQYTGQNRVTTLVETHNNTTDEPRRRQEIRKTDTAVFFPEPDESEGCNAHAKPVKLPQIVNKHVEIPGDNHHRIARKRKYRNQHKSGGHGVKQAVQDFFPVFSRQGNKAHQDKIQINNGGKSSITVNQGKNRRDAKKRERPGHEPVVGPKFLCQGDVRNEHQNHPSGHQLRHNHHHICGSFPFHHGIKYRIGYKGQGQKQGLPVK